MVSKFYQSPIAPMTTKNNALGEGARNLGVAGGQKIGGKKPMTAAVSPNRSRPKFLNEYHAS